MFSESLRGIRTLRRMTTGLDIARKARCITINSLSGIEARTRPMVDGRKLAIDLWRERRRFERQDEILRRSKEKLLVMRDKLSGLKARNEEIMKLRLALLRERYAVSEEARALETLHRARMQAEPQGGGHAPGTGDCAKERTRDHAREHTAERTVILTY